MQIKCYYTIRTHVHSWTEWRAHIMNIKEYERATFQILKRIHRIDFWIKIYTYVKTLSEMQGD